MPITRRHALGLGGLAILAAACGTTTHDRRRTAVPQPTNSANPLTGQPLESKLEFYNWSQYDDPSTFKKFTQLPDEAAVGMKTHETFYSSNDELLAKVNAGGAAYDIVVPSQNAVAQLIEEGKLFSLDFDLIPNISEPRSIVPASRRTTRPASTTSSRTSASRCSSTTTRSSPRTRRR